MHWLPCRQSAEMACARFNAQFPCTWHEAQEGWSVVGRSKIMDLQERRGNSDLSNKSAPMVPLSAPSNTPPQICLIIHVPNLRVTCGKVFLDPNLRCHTARVEVHVVCVSYLPSRRSRPCGGAAAAGLVLAVWRLSLPTRRGLPSFPPLSMQCARYQASCAALFSPAHAVSHPGTHARIGCIGGRGDVGLCARALPSIGDVVFRECSHLAPPYSGSTLLACACCACLKNARKPPE